MNSGLSSGAHDAHLLPEFPEEPKVWHEAAVHPRSTAREWRPVASEFVADDALSADCALDGLHRRARPLARLLHELIRLLEQPGA